MSEASEATEAVRDQRLTIRISADEKKLIEEAAWRRKMRTAEWLRQMALATAKHQLNPR